MSWYRTYRPQTVAGLHIASVRDSLSKMLESGNIPHALLFAGSKGTGKTSSARIIAKVLNCEKNAHRKASEPFREPCNTCTLCVEITNGSSLNVVEMDGASNRRIDDIRQLKERLYMPPAVGEKSVYIIDEVHMLTKEAFNALLKMLEEPPEHVVFIFATTDPQKIPDTILSRCTRVRFLKASNEELATALSQIATHEKLAAESSAIQMIAQSADGSFRDAVKVFEQLAREAQVEQAQISMDWVISHLSTLSLQKVKNLIGFILAKDENSIIDFFKTTRSEGVEGVVLHKQILSYLHQELIKSFGNTEQAIAGKEILIFLLKQFSLIEIPLQHPFPLLPLELCALEMVLKSKAKGTTQVSSSPVVSPQSSVKAVTSATHTMSNHTAPTPKVVIELDSSAPLTVPIEASTRVSEQPVSYKAKTDDKDVESIPSSLSTNEPINQSTNQLNSLHGSIIGQKWQDLLKTIGKRNLSLEAILRSAQFVSGDEGKATVKVFYGFHKEQLELDRYRILIDQAIKELLDGHVRFEYVLSTQAKEQSNTVDANVSGKQDEGLVNAIEEALM